MTPSILFLTGLGLTLVTAMGIVGYLRSPLHSILAELCGTRQRADFWVAFCNVAITLVPMIFAMQYVPQFKDGNGAVLELAAQLKWALAGLLASVVLVGWILSRFILRHPVIAGAPRPPLAENR